MIKSWPEDDQTVSFDDLVDPVVKAIEFAYTLHRKNTNKNIPWTGLDISSRHAACCLTAEKMFSNQNLTYAEQQQGRTPLIEILGHAMRVAMEQGRREYINSDEHKIIKIEADLGKLFLSREKE